VKEAINIENNLREIIKEVPYLLEYEQINASNIPGGREAVIGERMQRYRWMIALNIIKLIKKGIKIEDSFAK